MSKNNIKSSRKKSNRREEKYTDIYTSLNCKFNGQCYKCKTGCAIHPKQRPAYQNNNINKQERKK